MVATSGDVLLEPDAVDAIKSELVPLATLITPNLPEAAACWAPTGRERGGGRSRRPRHCSRSAARRCWSRAGTATATTPSTCCDACGVERFARPRIDTPHTHGTGCTLSAAIAALLAQGAALGGGRPRQGFRLAGAAAGRTLGVGRGRGPSIIFLRSVAAGRRRDADLPYLRCTCRCWSGPDFFCRFRSAILHDAAPTIVGGLRSATKVMRAIADFAAA